MITEAIISGTHTERASGRLLMLSLLFATLWAADPADAAYGTVSPSHVDPEIMKINEQQYLGVSLDSDYRLIDSAGKEFSLAEMSGKPYLLVLSYYDCDGACSLINKNLKNTLSQVDAWTLGKDFRVLTVSFDRNDTPETLQMFLHHAGFVDGLPDGWRMAMLKDPADIERLTGSVGYKFFWEPRDRVFLHPNVYLMVSPEGRVVRFLYGSTISAQDVEYSITKAFGNELSASNVINFILGACYSYNYKDGKYSLNYPLFIALGSLVIGIVGLIWGSIVMRQRAEA